MPTIAPGIGGRGMAPMQMGVGPGMMMPWQASGDLQQQFMGAMMNMVNIGMQMGMVPLPGPITPFNGPWPPRPAHSSTHTSTSAATPSPPSQPESKRRKLHRPKPPRQRSESPSFDEIQTKSREQEAYFVQSPHSSPRHSLPLSKPRLTADCFPDVAPVSPEVTDAAPPSPSPVRETLAPPSAFMSSVSSVSSPVAEEQRKSIQEPLECELQCELCLQVLGPDDTPFFHTHASRRAHAENHAKLLRWELPKALHNCFPAEGASSELENGEEDASLLIVPTPETRIECVELDADLDGPSNIVSRLRGLTEPSKQEEQRQPRLLHLFLALLQKRYQASPDKFMKCSFERCRMAFRGAGRLKPNHFYVHFEKPLLRCRRCGSELTSKSGHWAQLHPEASPAEVEAETLDERGELEEELLETLRLAFPALAEARFLYRQPRPGLEPTLLLRRIDKVVLDSAEEEALMCRYPGCTAVICPDAYGRWSTAAIQHHVLSHWQGPGVFACKACDWTGSDVYRHQADRHSAPNSTGLGPYSDRRKTHEPNLLSLLSRCFS